MVLQEEPVNRPRMDQLASELLQARKKLAIIGDLPFRVPEDPCPPLQPENETLPTPFSHCLRRYTQQAPKLLAADHDRGSQNLLNALVSASTGSRHGVVQGISADMLILRSDLIAMALLNLWV